MLYGTDALHLTVVDVVCVLLTMKRLDVEHFETFEHNRFNIF